MQYQIIIIKFSQSDMDFYSTLGFEFAGCLVITFSPSKTLEMHRYYRNAHVTPSLNPLWPQLIVRKRRLRENAQIRQQKAYSDCS